VVIINLEKGHYYSLVKAGADIWSGIERGLSQDQIVVEMMQRYDGDSQAIANGVRNLIEKLQEEELIAVALESSNGDIAAESPATNPQAEKFPFEPPTLEKYTDMEDLLLLDPIHEVDETGWPSTKLAQV
jgi:hypothetical protein